MGAGNDALVLLSLVLVADALLAGLPILRHVLALPLAAVAQMAGWFDRKLNREERSVVNRLLRGALAVCAAWHGRWPMTIWSPGAAPSRP